jgi:hypothetical protein
VTSGVIASGTAITNLTYDSDINLYKIYLNNNLSGSANTHYFGDNTNRLITRANDIHLYLKYNVDNQLQTTYVKLDKSPTWIVQWYKKSSWNYLELDNYEMSDLTSAHHNINFDNFSGLGQTNYFITLFRLPLANTIGYEIDYVYQSENFSRMRKGKIFIAVDKLHNGVQLVDEYEFVGTTGETNLEFKAEMADSDGNSTLDTIKVSYKNTSVADNGTFIYSYKAVS